MRDTPKALASPPYDPARGEAPHGGRRPPPPGRRGLARAVLTAPFTARAWAEAAFCLAAFPLTLAGFLLAVVLLCLGSGLLVSLIGGILGALFLVLALALARGLGGAHRALARWLLGEHIPSPVPSAPARGPFGRLDARLRDAAAWRCVAYVVVKLPVSAFGLYAVVWWLTGLTNLTTPLRWGLLGQYPGHGGERGAPTLTPLPFGGSPRFHTFGGTLLAALVGALTLLVAPWLTRAVVLVDRRLMRELLGPGTLAERVRDLEETRALAVDDAAALLRRVERDLHDGAQVRLVALAMSLDMIREGLAAGAPGVDVDRLRRLVETAHHNATEAIGELRDLARGIHPPALDDGLPDALATLAARSTVPVELSVDVPVRPSAAIETIAYFCAAELLTNVIKHSGARRAAVSAAQRGGALLLGVTDDGHGGAGPGRGSGLTGLRQRVRTVDGTVDIHSPPGGPTVITVELPLHA
ncbi:histidine kinase [Streptomyces sulfonofaciens]|uniref:histidine kinase n=1 Tax=Streptomyces sulfonofaciens TaxID=68272 RepID=A0A919KV85_9ACTN|nr:sensor histidine kinase [Streptomyces sulfonofaciens]GHH72911.1 histidine kinase [Streptomyces sulfonofaciens]